MHCPPPKSNHPLPVSWLLIRLAAVSDIHRAICQQSAQGANDCHCGQPPSTSLHSLSKADKWGGHSLRRGGIQYMCSEGVDLCKVAAIARSTSNSILAYVDNSLLEQTKSVARDIAKKTQDRMRKSIHLLPHLNTLTAATPRPSRM